MTSPSPAGAVAVANQASLRIFGEARPMSELTGLLHRAYARLAAMGLRYMATHQSDDVTRDRVASGECWVALVDERLVGTILFKAAGRTAGSPWLDRPEVASLGQFAVMPEWQGTGLGTWLLDHAERRAAETGAKEIALDTAEQAEHLVAPVPAPGLSLHRARPVVPHQLPQRHYEQAGARERGSVKFIHLSDPHLIAPGDDLHGLAPQDRLECCVAHIRDFHADAAFVVLTGDITHGGEPAGYEVARAILAELPMPLHVTIGNHDSRSAFRAAFPHVPVSEGGFAAQGIGDAFVWNKAVRLPRS